MHTTGWHLPSHVDAPTRSFVGCMRPVLIILTENASILPPMFLADLQGCLLWAGGGAARAAAQGGQHTGPDQRPHGALEHATAGSVNSVAWLDKGPPESLAVRSAPAKSLKECNRCLDRTKGLIGVGLDVFVAAGAQHQGLTDPCAMRIVISLLPSHPVPADAPPPAARINNQLRAMEALLSLGARPEPKNSAGQTGAGRMCL